MELTVIRRTRIGCSDKFLEPGTKVIVVATRWLDGDDGMQLLVKPSEHSKKRWHIAARDTSST